MFKFIETKLFTRLVCESLSDEEYQDLQAVLVAQPTVGDLIPGSGGVRKLRWRAPGRGKRGGIRVIYVAKVEVGEIWMLTMYPKNVRDSISAKVLRQICKEMENG